MRAARAALALAATLLASPGLAWFDGSNGVDGNPFAVSECSASGRQLWRLLANGTVNNGAGYCMDVFDRSSQDGTHVNAWRCLGTGENYEQQFTFDSSSSLLRASSRLGSKCVEVTSDDPLSGMAQLWECDPKRKAQQQLAFDDSSGLIRLVANSSMCLGASGGSKGSACGTRPGAAWCDTSKSALERASAIVAALDTDDQASLLSTHSFAKEDGGHTPGIRRLGIPPIQIHSEGLHGIRTGVALARINTTLFPQVTGMAATLNASLWRAMGGVMRQEARAVYNLIMAEGEVKGRGGGLFYWGPTQNIATRDPRWGRAQESVGSSVLLNSAYSVAFIRSFQAPDPLAGRAEASAIAACAKHSWAYSLEASDGFTRHTFTSRVGPEDAVLTYLAVFRSSIQAGEPLQVMCSYNAVAAANASAASGGVPTCALGAVQNGLFRDQWGYDGMVVSDCDAVGDEFRSHKYVPDAAHASAASILAGTDVDCGSTYDAVREAIGLKLLGPEDVALAAVRALTARVRTGEFDPPSEQPLANATEAADSNTAASQQLALEAAQQSIVLLGNRNATLPLRPARGSTVALIGPVGDDATFLMGSKHDYTPAHIVTYLEGLTAAAAEAGFRVTAEPGSGVTAPVDGGLARARAAAASADAVVLAVGIDGTVEHEAGDRTTLELPSAQLDLVRAVLGAVRPRTPVVLVLGNGGPVSVGGLWNDTRLGAAVEALEGGQAAGTALAGVLLGSVRPSGALPYQLLPPGYVDLVNMSDMSMRAGPGRTFRYTQPAYEQEWPFGHWLGFDDVTPSSAGAGADRRSLREGFAVSVSVADLASAARDGRGGSGGRGAFAGLPLPVALRNGGAEDAARPVMAFLSRRRKAGDATRGPVMALADAGKALVPAGGTASLTLDLARPLLLAAAKAGAPAAEPTDRPGSCSACEYEAVGGTDAAVIAPGVYDVWVGGFGRIPAAVHRSRAAAATDPRGRAAESALADRAALRWDGGALCGTLTVTGAASEVVWTLPHGALPQ